MANLQVKRYTLRRFRPIFRPKYDGKLDTLYPVSKLGLYIGQTLPLPYTDVTRHSFLGLCFLFVFFLLFFSFCFCFVCLFIFIEQLVTSLCDSLYQNQTYKQKQKKRNKNKTNTKTNRHAKTKERHCKKCNHPLPRES